MVSYNLVKSNTLTKVITMADISFLGESYLQKMADLSPSSQMGQPNQVLGTQYQPRVRLQSKDKDDFKQMLARIISGKNAPYPHFFETQTPDQDRVRNPEQNDPYAKYIDSASVRAAKKYLPGADFESKIQ
jgi:hypothetical protein